MQCVRAGSEVNILLTGSLLSLPDNNEPDTSGIPTLTVPYHGAATLLWSIAGVHYQRQAYASVGTNRQQIILIGNEKC